MLSTESIKKANQARHYFLGEDNYYTKENDATEKSQWWGKGAAALGLKGEVSPLTFTELLKGKLPNGQELGVIQNNELKHRPGFDLTFSVPKSVSLVALLGEDSRIYGAIQQAVDHALERIEACAKVRVTRQGVTSYESTDNLVVAKFLHDISREGDPQLHVHCVVMNMTKRSDNLWRSLASQAGKYNSHVIKEIHGFFEQVRHHKHYYGLLFRAELAHELKQLGYELEKTEKGFFEIAGFSQETLAAYSTRRQQVTDYLQERGYTGGKAAAVATLKTRKPKNINRETVRELWEARGKTHQVDGYREAKEVVSQSLNPQKESDSPSADIKAKEAVQRGILHLSETKIVLPQIQLINTALESALTDGIHLKTIIQAINELQASGELIALSRVHPSQGTCFTTKKILYYEQQILEAINKEHPSQQPLLAEQKLKDLLASVDLDTKEKHAIKSLFTNKHQVFALEGPQAQDNTSILKPLVELTKIAGYTSVILTPNKLSQIQIQESLQPTSSLQNWIKKHFDFTQVDTVARFIAVQEKWLATGQNGLPKAVLFVDQATILSSKQMHDLIQITQQTKSRLVLLGDAKSLLPWQAGSPFLQMINAGMAQATLVKNDQNESKRAQSHILSIENKMDRLERMADHYINLPQEKQKKACVMMPTKAACEEINLLIHQKLKEATSTNGEEVVVLVPSFLSSNQRTLAKHYPVGHYVRFNHPCRSLGIKTGNYYQIRSIKADENRITLQHKGRSLSWDLGKNKELLNNIELFEEKKREFLVGETLMCQRTDVRKRLTKGERFYIETIQKNKMQVRRENGRLIHIPLKQSHTHHFDYGYSVTPYQASVRRYDTVIAYQHSTSRQSNRRSFYKIINQANKQVWLYTENQNQLLATLQKQTGDKATAICTLLGREADALPFNELKQLLEKAFIEARESLKKKCEGQNSAIQAEEAVEYALANLSQREAAFSHQEVLSVALQQALGQVAIQDIEKAVLNLENKGGLIRGLYSQDGIHWTTAHSLEMEKRIIELAHESLGKLDAMLRSDAIESYLLNTPLKLEHAKALKEIASSTDGVMLLQGYAGTGKTTLVKQIETLLNQQAHLTQTNYQILCLAPTHTAVKELKERGLRAETVDSYLAQSKSSIGGIPQYDDRQIIVVDESSMLSNQRLHDLLSTTQQAKARVLLMGDSAQYSAIDAGKPFTLLQQSGLKVIQLTDINRQKEATLKKAVSEVYKGQYSNAFSILSSHIIEIGQKKEGEMLIDHREQRLAAITQDYLSRSSLKRSQTLLITLSNRERVALNALIRKNLKLTGELQDNGVMTNILVAKDLTEAQKKETVSYRVNDIIRFNYSDNACQIGKNTYLTILAAQDNFLILQNEKDQEIVWEPRHHAKRIEVYALAHRELQVGDLISWTRSDKTLGLLSRELAKVEAVDSQTFKIKSLERAAFNLESEEKLITIPYQARKFQHWDHAYALTGYSAQSKTIESVILNIDSHHPYLVNQPSFLIGLTRAVQDITIYTDNKGALLARLLNNTGEKASALELMELKRAQVASIEGFENKDLCQPRAFKGVDKEIPDALIRQVCREMTKEHLVFNNEINQAICSNNKLSPTAEGEILVTLDNTTQQNTSKTIPKHSTLTLSLEQELLPNAVQLEKTADKEIEL